MTSRSTASPRTDVHLLRTHRRAALLAAAVVFSDVVQSGLAEAAPRALAIYYGIPSLVNGAGGDVSRAAATFGDYDIVVFGDGLEFDDVVPERKPAGPGLLEHQRTAAIVRALSASSPHTSVYGYIDLGRSQQLDLAEIQSRIQRWKAVGVAGIFFDEAGADFGVTRARQNAAVDAAHAAGLAVALNAFDPDDVFAVRDDAAPHLRPGDAYLLESFGVRNGRAETGPALQARTDKARRGARACGAHVWAVTTTTGAFDAGQMTQTWTAAAAAGIDAFGWGEPSFSSLDSRLPWRPRPDARTPHDTARSSSSR